MERDFEDIDRILNFAAEAGRNMLKCGGEIYRVEDTIQRLCMAFGIDNAEVFVTPTTLLLSVYKNKKVYSVVKRINERSTDLNMMKKINALSRNIAYEKLSIDECEERLEDICKKESYSYTVTILGAGLVTSCFSILFGGGEIDFIMSFLVGMVTKILQEYLSEKSLNEFFVNIICAAFIAMSSVVCVEGGVLKTMDYIIAGVIMLLVPGFALTNAIRDILDGQLVAGTAKLSEVIFSGTATAVGMALVLNWYLRGGFF